MSVRTGKFARLVQLGSWPIFIALLMSIACTKFQGNELRTLALPLGAAERPYTTILRETVYGAQGEHRPGGTYTWAVRSNGSRANRMEFSDLGHSSSQLNIDFSSGKRVRLDELRTVKSTTTYIDANSNTWVRAPQSSCVNTASGRPMMPGQVVAGTEDVGGYRSTKIVQNNMSWWYAVEYGCALVKFEAKWNGDERSAQELVALIPGEPSASLFAVPASFSEVAPSHLYAGLPRNAQLRLDLPYYIHHRPE